MRMKQRRSRGTPSRVAIIAGLFGFPLIMACAGEQPKSAPQPTAEQVRSHADRAFDKLKQEEQERGAQTPMPR